MTINIPRISCARFKKYMLFNLTPIWKPVVTSFQQLRNFLHPRVNSWQQVLTLVCLGLVSLGLASCQKEPEPAKEPTGAEKQFNYTLRAFLNLPAVDQSLASLNEKYVQEANQAVQILPFDARLEDGEIQFSYNITNTSTQGISSVFFEALVYLNNQTSDGSNMMVLLVPIKYDTRDNLTLSISEEAEFPVGNSFNFNVNLTIQGLKTIPGIPTSVSAFIDGEKLQIVGFRTIIRHIVFDDGSFIDTSAVDSITDEDTTPIEGFEMDSLEISPDTITPEGEQPSVPITSPDTPSGNNATPTDAPAVPAIPSENRSSNPATGN